MNLPKKKTKIVCTIGPASWNQEVLEEMIKAGMNIARINLAHGDFDGHRRSINNVRTAAKTIGQRVTIFADLPGPKMRIGKLAQEEIILERGQTFILQTQEIIGDHTRVSMDFEGLPRVVKPGDNIFMNDGYIQLEVHQIVDHEVHCIVKVGGELRANNGVNLPGIDLGISAFTERDQDLLAFAAEEQVEGVGISFVQSADDISAVRQAAANLAYDPFIIAKIERAMALDNIEAILETSDGIMIARGDLGVEIPIEKIPSAQKQLIRLANLASKPVITATQMLESMTYNRQPTRSEATDVANAILDGTDCVMLSGETAIGSYPVETVSTMAKLAEEAEGKIKLVGIADLLELKQERGNISHTDLVSLAVFLSIKTLQPELVIILAKSGATARRVSRFGLNQWIAAPSLYEITCQNLQFSRGIHPTLVTDESALATPEARRNYASELLRRYDVDCGVVLVIEGSGTLQTQEIKRIDIINLG